jgi:hypothetical protein
VHRPRVRQYLGHLGLLEQPGQPDDLDRDVALVEGALDQAEQPRRPAQHRDVGPPRAAVVQPRDGLGDRPSLAPFVHEARDRDLALAVGGRRAELLVGVGALRVRDRRDQRVCRGQDPRSRAEVGVERQPRGRRAVGPAEPLRELEQVVKGCPPPRVDVLIRVADRGDRMAPAEQGVHQVGLGDVRVLILVQKDRGEPGAMVQDDLRIALGDLDRPIDLVAEVDHPELALELSVARGRLGQLQTLLGGLEDAVRPGALEQLEPRRDVRLDLHRRDPMVLRLLVELQDLGDERRLPRGRGMLERHAVEDARAQLGPLGLRQHAGSRLEAGEDPVSLQERGREPVVVGDLGLLSFGELERRERPADPEPKVVRRLVREGEAQHVPGQDPLIGVDAVDPAEGRQGQVNDARGHHRGLPGPGARDQHARLEGPRDRRPLLLGGIGAHRGGDLAGNGPRLRDAHADAASKICLPSGHRGQSVRKSHQKQSAWGLGR